MTELISEQAAPSLEGLFNQLWHHSWNQTGRTRSRGLKETTKRPKMTAKQRAMAAFEEACKTTHPEIVIKAAKAFAERSGEYTPCLGTWLEEARYETEDVTTGNADKIEAKPTPGKRWTMAEGRAKQMLQAMHEQGCPEDVLDGLYGDGIGVTSVNCDRGMPPTAVIRTNNGWNLWFRAASGFAKRAGYNEIAYSKDYVAMARAKKAAASAHGHRAQGNPPHNEGA